MATAQTQSSKKIVKKPFPLAGLKGLELHRAKLANAKLNGTKVAPSTKKKVIATKRAALPTFKAPEEFKPYFLEVFIRTEKDGLLASAIKAIHYTGRYDVNTEDKKKRDLATYDTPTLMGVLSRLSAVTYATNMQRRLPPLTAFRILLRVNKRAKDLNLAIAIKHIAMGKKSAKSGRIIYKEMERSEPYFRSIRKATRILPAAFTKIVIPPKLIRGSRKVNEEE